MGYPQVKTKDPFCHMYRSNKNSDDIHLHYSIHSVYTVYLFLLKTITIETWSRKNTKSYDSIDLLYSTNNPVSISSLRREHEVTTSTIEPVFARMTSHPLITYLK